jgi:uncharacterized lipoprotein YddW (UPF0748 family)
VFANPEHERLQKIQQDWGTWAREGYVDWIVLMSYAEDTSRFSQLINPWLVDGDFASALIIPGIRLLNLDNSAAIDQIQVTRDLPTLAMLCSPPPTFRLNWKLCLPIRRSMRVISNRPFGWPWGVTRRCNENGTGC